MSKKFSKRLYDLGAYRHPEMTMPTMVTDVCLLARVRRTGTPAASMARIGNALVAQRVEARGDDAG